MNEIISKQLESKAEEFVRECQNIPSEEVSKIIAGLTAVIKGNVEAYESMKNQRWFERIWYGLTGKNKATVKEMQANRDKLTGYTVQILVKMNELLDEHGECIRDLYMALAIVRNDLGSVVDEVKKLAVKLNEKIIRIETYNDLITDIQNKKYDSSKPLLSLIEIMSLVDQKTASNTAKLLRLKETMEQNGFDFSQTVDISKYYSDVIEMSEDIVGRVLLFCQSYSDRSRFLAFTCNLVENYFYMGETDRQEARKNNEAFDKALRSSRLSQDSSCSVEGMYNDLKHALPSAYQFTNLPIEISNDSEKMSSHNEEKPIKILITGEDRSGKHTLKAALKAKCPALNIKITDGFSLQSKSNEKNQAITNEIGQYIEEHNFKIVLMCIPTMSTKLDDYIRDFLQKYSRKYKDTEFIIVLTKSVAKNTAKELKQYIQTHTDCDVICVLAEKWEVDDNICVEPYGIDELVNIIRQKNRISL